MTRITRKAAQRRTSSHLPLLAILAALAALSATTAHAVRPFVTDDGRIADHGQIEGETWLELGNPGRRVVPVYNVLLNIEAQPWLEIGLQGGLGWDVDDTVTIADPSFQLKLLFVRPEDDAWPGVGLVAGVTTPWGRGTASLGATGGYVIVPATVSLFRGFLQIHVNGGWIGASTPDDPFRNRGFWGLGFDAGLWHEDIRAIAEVFAGDPLDVFGPTFAFQSGVRWIVSDHINLDVAAGGAPAWAIADSDSFEWSVQIGLRFLINAFVPRGQSPHPGGGRGMFTPTRRAER